MYTEENGRTTVQSKAQDDDNRRVRNYTNESFVNASRAKKAAGQQNHR